MTVRSYVALGDLAPTDVEVQLVSGRVDAEDVLVDPAITVLHPTESYDGGRHLVRRRGRPRSAAARSATPCASCRRIPLLVAPAELGVVTVA